MPLPVILGGLAAAAAAGGAVGGVKGAGKMVKANRTMKDAKKRHEENLKAFEQQNVSTCKDMDALGEAELKILKGFEDFSFTFEKIKNRPTFAAYDKDDVQIPEYDGEKLKNVSIGAGVLLGGLGGAALGTAGGFAAAGATTSAVMALGTASTGATIASLSGAAATNATLAAIGGGAIAAGGGGMALGATILSATTLGVGILVGGIIFNVVGGSISSKAEEAKAQAAEAEKKIANICDYLKELSKVSQSYLNAINAVNEVYLREFESMKARVNVFGLVDYNDYNEEQRKNIENTVLLVQLLYRMCQVRLVLENNEKDGLNTINTSEITDVIGDSQKFLEDRFHVGGKE